MSTDRSWRRDYLFTFDHLNVIGDKTDIILYFQTRMSGVLQNHITRALP